MDCLDYSRELKDIHLQALSRRDALSGFRLNKTVDGPWVGAYGELIAERFLQDSVASGHIKTFSYIGDGLGADFIYEDLKG